MSPTPTVRATVARTTRRIGTTVGHRVLERARSFAPTDAAEVPSSASGLSAAWLSSALCAGTSGAHVVGVKQSGETSQTTSRASLRLTYDEAGRAAGLPEAVFAKSTASVRQRLFLGLIRCLEGEPRFYADLRPNLDLNCPQGYFGAFDPASWRSIVLIEDIAATRGATFCHATSAVSRDDIESLLTVMAGYHGAMWEAQAIQGPGAAWLKTPLDHFHNTSAFLNMRKRCEVGVQRTAPLIPSAVRDAPDALWEGLMRSMRLSSEGPTTLLHGDPHVGNTYRTAPGRMALADWQVCMRGHWAFDVAYAISTALTVEDRRAWEQDLVAHYLEQLARAGGQAPELEEARVAYRRNLFYPWHTWVTVIGRSAVQPLMQEEDVCRLIIERVSAAIDDLGVLRSF